MRYLLAAAILALSSHVANAETVLKAASFLPSNLALTKDFLSFVDTINAELDDVEIDFVGGPESIPGEKQPQALQRGVLDISYISPSRFAGIAPEGDALLGSNLTLEELHESGAFDALDKIFQEKASVKILAVHHQGLDYNIYLKNEPKFTADGVPDLSGLTIRTSATYREFLDVLGATPVSVPGSEIFSAMERGVVEGLAWPSVDVVSMGFQNVASYRIEPGFFNAPNITVISLKAWNALEPGQREKLTELARAHEKLSAEQVSDIRDEERKALQDGGLKLVTVPNPDAYAQLAYKTIWDRLAERAPDSASQLEPLFLKD